MRGLMSILRRTDDARQVGQYWDEVVRRAPATPLPRSDAAAEAGETIGLMYGLEEQHFSRAPFADRQLQMLLTRTMAMTVNAQSVPLPGSRPHDGLRWPKPGLAERSFRESRRGMLPALSAATAIALLLAITLVLTIFSNLLGNRKHQPAVLAPTTLTAQPSPSTAATARLVWTYTGSDKTALDHPTSVTIAPDGNIWVVDGMNNRIVILGPDGQFMGSRGSRGLEDGRFLFGSSVSYSAGELAFGQDGSIYVAEAAARRVQRFDKNFNFMMSWSGVPTPSGNFSFLTGIAVDPDGNVWVSDSGGAVVSKFSPEGRYLLSLGTDNALIWPCSVGFDRAGNLLLSNGRGELDVYGLDGTLLHEMVLNDAKGQPVVNVSDISTDPVGNMYVVAGSGAAFAVHPYPVLVYDPSGNLLLEWTGTDAHQLEEPWIVAPDGEGNMYIVDSVSSSIQKVHVNFAS
jgi:hypothetical protein